MEKGGFGQGNNQETVPCLENFHVLVMLQFRGRWGLLGFPLEVSFPCTPISKRILCCLKRFCLCFGSPGGDGGGLGGKEMREGRGDPKSSLAPGFRGTGPSSELPVLNWERVGLDEIQGRYFSG